MKKYLSTELIHNTIAMKRRRLIAKMAAGSIGFATIGSKANGRGVEDQSAEEVGLSSKIKSLVREGKISEAKKIAEHHNIEHTFGKEELKLPYGKQTDRTKINPTDYLNKSNSTVTLFTTYDRDDPQGDEIHFVNLLADMDNQYWDLLSEAPPKDGMAVTWSDSYFQPVEQSQSNFNPTLDTQYIDYQDYKRYGVWAKIDDQGHVEDVLGNDNLQVQFDTEIEKLDDNNKYNVNAEYLHNWNTGGFYKISEFSLGRLGIDFSGSSVDDWRIEKTNKV